MNLAEQVMLEEELRSRMKDFVRGLDRSKPAAGRIEVLLDELYEDVEPQTSLMLALASYDPAGGPFLYDEETIITMMKAVLVVLGSPVR